MGQQRLWDLGATFGMTISTDRAFQVQAVTVRPSHRAEEKNLFQIVLEYGNGKSYDYSLRSFDPVAADKERKRIARIIARATARPEQEPPSPATAPPSGPAPTKSTIGILVRVPREEAVIRGEPSTD